MPQSALALQARGRLTRARDVSWQQEVNDMNRARDSFIHAFRRFQTLL